MITREPSIETLSSWTELVVEKFLSVDQIQEEDINDFIQVFLNRLIFERYFPSEKLESVKLHTVHSLHEFPMRTVPITKIGEIEPWTIIRVDIEHFSEKFSKLKASGLGSLDVSFEKKNGKIVWKVKTKGFWVTEVSEMDPSTDEEKRSNELQKFLKDIVIETIKVLLLALLFKAVPI